MKQEIGTTVEIDGVERDVTLEFALYPEEAASASCPGCPADAELLRAMFDDDGSEVPPGVISDEDVRELGIEASALRADEEAAQKEDAGIARRERRMERAN